MSDVKDGLRGGCFTIDEKMANTYVFEEMANTLASRDYKMPQAVILWKKQWQEDPPPSKCGGGVRLTDMERKPGKER